MPVYARHGLEYAQQRPDGRVVLGGFSDLDGDASWTNDAVVSERVSDGSTSTCATSSASAPGHPPLGRRGGVRRRPLPRCGSVPGTNERIFALGGYNGTGVVQSFVAARIVAEHLTSGPGPDADLYAPVDA
jgi:glycine/D-amino acid oxidase-like deaminating enzyme